MTTEPTTQQKRKATLDRRTDKLIASLSPANRMLLERQLDARRNKGIRTGSNTAWAEAWKRADEAAGGRDFRTLTARDWTDVVARLRKGGYAPGRGPLQQSTLYSFTNYLKSSINAILAIEDGTEVSEEQIRRDPQSALAALLIRMNRTDGLAAIRKALTVQEPERKPKGRILSEDDLNALLRWVSQQAQRGRYSGPQEVMLQALLWFLWDTGFRASEALAMRAMDFRIEDNHGADVVLPPDAEFLKTNDRQVYVSECVGPVRAWLSLHPAAHLPDAPLFPGVRSLDGLTAMGYKFLDDFIGLAAAESGVNASTGRTKPVTAHDFRHTRATRAARANWSNSKMESHFGWEEGSSMPSYYAKLARTDMREQVRRDAGIDDLGYRVGAVKPSELERMLDELLARREAAKAAQTARTPEWRLP